MVWYAPWREKAEPIEERANLENPQVPITGYSIDAHTYWGGGVQPTVVPVTEDNALSVPAVWTAVNFISSTLASLPLKVYRKTRDGRSSAPRDPLYYLLHEAPNPEWTSYRWRKYTMTRTLLGGRSYTYIERANNGKIAALWPIDPHKVTPVKSGMVTSYVFRPTQGDPITYSSEEIIDIPYMLEPDQVSWVSPVGRLKGVVSLSIALQSYAERYFANGGVPPVALEGPFQSPGAMERAAKQIVQWIRNAANSGEMVLPVPPDHKFAQIGYNPEQGQLVDARRYMVEDVARMYSLPPVFLQDLSKGTYSNTEQQDLQVVKHTLTQWISSWEQEMNLKLFGFGRSNKFVEFSVDGLLRGDFKTRMEGYAKAVQNSISTPNEIRNKENDPPKDGGDILAIQQNMTDLKTLSEEPQDDDGNGNTDGGDQSQSGG